MGVIILGIDPGLANTGWGVVERSGSRLRALAYGCVSSKADEQLAQRLAASGLPVDLSGTDWHTAGDFSV